MEDMLPCLFIGKFGVGRERNSQMNKMFTGIYVLGAPSGDGACPCSGIIVPLSRIRNETLHNALLKVCELLCNPPYKKDGSKRIDKAQDILDSTLGDGLIISKQCYPPTNMIEFDRTKSKSLYKLLAGQADYVTKVKEKAGGVAVATEFQPFIWENYFVFTEWFNESLGDMQWGIAFPTPMLIFTNASGLEDFSDSEARSRLATPGLALNSFFSVQPDVIEQQIKVEINMETYGWANMVITCGISEKTIALSNVYPPFEQLVGWVKLVAIGSLPIQIEIDEEGINTCLTAYPTDSAENLFFVVHEKYDEANVSIQCIVNTDELVAVFRNELRRFFQEDFDAEHWDSEDDEESPLLLRMESDKWLNSDLL